MEKERALMPDLGIINDLYYNSTGVNFPVSEKHLIDDNWMLRRFFDAMARRTVKVTNLPAHLGYERIEGTVSDKEKLGFNQVLHVKNRYVNYPFGFALLPMRSAIQNGFAREYFRQAPPAKADTQVDFQDIWKSLPLQQVKARAWYSMQPEFRSDFSLMNFLLELKDFKEAALVIGRERKAISKVTGRLRKLRAEMYRGGIHKFDPTIPASGIILTTNLAIKPFIRDVVEIVSLVKGEVGKAQREFESLGKTLQTSNYSERFITEDSRVQPYGDYVWLRRGKSTVTTFTATLKYMYDYKMRSDFIALCKYWGFDGSLSTAWNALPFSFIVDYGIRIGDALRLAEGDDHVKLFTKVYGESLKTIRSSGDTFHDDSRLLSVVLNGIPLKPRKRTGSLIAGTFTSAYYRYPTEPYKGLLVPKLKKPNTTQLLNMLALARLLWV